MPVCMAILAPALTCVCRCACKGYAVSADIFMSHFRPEAAAYPNDFHDGKNDIKSNMALCPYCPMGACGACLVAARTATCPNFPGN